MEQFFKKTILACLMLTAATAQAQPFSGSGAGTSVSPYLITSGAQLNEVRNNLAAHYLLADNIDAGSNWVPIGDNSTDDKTTRFTGSFDGDGHTITISGVTPGLIISGDVEFIGLFGYLGVEALVQNLTVEAAVTYSSTLGMGCTIGGITGESYGTVRNCAVTGTLTGTADSWGICVGGIAGQNNGTIQNCYSTADVSATYDDAADNSAFAGGIAASNAGTVNACFAKGSVYASAQAAGYAYSGGIIGMNFSGNIKNSVALNAGITAGGMGTQYRGRIAGYNLMGTLSNNYAIAISALPDGTLTNMNGLLISPVEEKAQTWWSDNAFNTVWSGATPNVNKPWVWGNSQQHPVLAIPRLNGDVTITGTSAYGSTLTANTSDIISAEPGTLTYQWIRNGATIIGTNSATYMLTADDIDSTVTVVVSAENYFGNLSDATGKIARKNVTIIGITADNKVYDGSLNATPVGTPTIYGNLDGVNLDCVPGTASFADKNAGNGKTVTFTGYTLSGPAADNYTLSQPAPTTANITPKPIIITGVTAENKEYDGSINATPSGTPTPDENENLDGINLTVDDKGVAAGFEDINVGNGKNVTFTGYTLIGSAAGNYTLSEQPQATANITPKAITVTVTPNQTKVYGATEPVLTYDVSPPLIGIDKFTGELNRTLGENAGNYNITQGSLSAENYEIKNAIAGQFVITPRPITIKAIDETIDHGQMPALKYKFSPDNRVNGDEITVGLTVEAWQVTSPPGAYSIDTLSGSANANANYKISFEKGSLVVRDVDASVIAIAVDEENAEQRDENNFTVLAECGENSVEIKVEAALNATVTIDGVQVPNRTRTVNLPNYGENNIPITITAQNGNKEYYTLVVNKPIPASVAFYDLFEGVLTVPVKLEGIGAVNSVEWFRDDVRLDRDPAKGYIETTEAGAYYALINGKIRTCEVIQLRSASAPTPVPAPALTMSVYPNPAETGREVIVSINRTADELQGAQLQLHGTGGRLLQILPVTGSETAVATPANTGGVVVIKLISSMGNSEVKLIIK